MAVRWISAVDQDDERAVGKKASALARAEEAGFSVPRGFVVTAQTFEQFVRSNGLEDEIRRLLHNADRDDRSSVEQAAHRIRQRITNSELSASEREEIVDAYEQINMSEEVRNAGGEARELVGGQRETEFVAVRASPTGTRIPGAHACQLNVNGKDSVIEAVKECWASLYAAAALRMEPEVGDIHSLAVIVQRMVEADVSGAALNEHPVTGDGPVIEAVWGLGTALSSGSATPDLYQVNAAGRLEQEEIANKGWKVVRDPTSGKTLKQRVAAGERDVRCLSEDQLQQVADAVTDLGERWRSRVQVDFAFGRSRLQVLDVTPVTPATVVSEQAGQEPLIRGRGGSAGSSTGPVNILYSDTDIDAITGGDIVVGVDAAERFIPALPEVTGLVADHGGITSNLSALARKLQIPVIVGTGNGTDMLTKGETVTINGRTGMVIEGEDTVQEAAEPEPVGPATPHVTATLVKALTPVRHGEADGVVIPDYTDPATASELARQHHPDTVWIRTDDRQHGQNLGILAPDHRSAAEGVVVSTYGGVMRSENLAADGVQFIGLDAAALQQDGGRQALVNAVRKVAEDGEHCETALLLQEFDSELVHEAVASGIDAVAVPGEQVSAARHAVARAERRLMLDKLRRL